MIHRNMMGNSRNNHRCLTHSTAHIHSHCSACSQKHHRHFRPRRRFSYFFFCRIDSRNHGERSVTCFFTPGFFLPIFFKTNTKSCDRCLSPRPEKTQIREFVSPLVQKKHKSMNLYLPSSRKTTNPWRRSSSSRART